MAEIVRPLFFEGQILAAQDLQESVEYARGKDHRHNRLAHRWGIASGLELTTESRVDAEDNEYVVVQVEPGVAIDGNGRELLLAESTRLSPDQFLASTVLVEDGEDHWYPVYLQGVDRQTSQAARIIDPCASSGGLPTRASEQVEIAFGRPGVQPDLPPPPTLGEETAAAPWPVLLGFVRWSTTAKQFSDATVVADGVAPRYIGVYASVVESRSGKVEIRTGASGEVGAPALWVDQDQLRFGLQNGNGQISNLFTVNRKGEATAGGKPIGGGVRTASGLLSHGMLVPLPANVEESAVASGAVTLHIDVTPHLDFPSDTGVDFVLPIRCVVDQDRRLHCLWYELPAFDPRPGVARYTITASAAASEEGA